ncbi:MAG TPA: class I mannose-6-phosphate isomerase [Bacteroidota bacterium]|nr:class I mannose-6-phosphate isomerase [Bacteroidota bacterium]
MSDFQKNPFVDVRCDAKVCIGWEQIGSQVSAACSNIPKKKKIILLELYQGTFEDEIVNEFCKALEPGVIVRTKDLYWEESKIRDVVHPDVTDDRIFGHLTRLTIDAFFDPGKLETARREISSTKSGIVLIAGTGASTVALEHDLLIYADMARWEIQLRMRRHEVGSIGLNNKDIPDWNLLYKQGYFVDWRVCDKIKKELMNRWDFFLDTNTREQPKLVEGRAVREGLRQCFTRPFSVVPFFDPGPWGGQWLKRVCDLDPSVNNYAWCFNCVPEENSLLLKIDNSVIEIPAIDLVFFNPQLLLGNAVYERFGDEFPIRFDYLDTMDGGNLSLQVHPLTAYIREQFGLDYTQDESYYLMDAKPGSVVYLGLKEGVDAAGMIHDLEEAQKRKTAFDADKFVQTWPVKKHDHFLIPAGTVHCSGKDSVVLEISATPYIFTFKLWDWGRLGLDGVPRPINIEHGKRVIQWDRTASWTGKNLVNRIEKIAEGDGWVEERTGLHEKEFIETRRHWFTKKIIHNTGDGVNVLTLVEGKEVVVESPSGAFDPFIVHYAETFIVPACIGDYSVTPFGTSEGKQCGTIKAYVRTQV